MDSQSDIPLELFVDGNLIATETFNGTILSNEVENYTFSQTLDLSNAGQTYTIEVKSNLTGDEFIPNNSFTKEVTHLLLNDVGALEITAPETGSGLGNEVVTFTIKNFGADAQSNFEVQYAVNGGTPVVETFSGSLISEEIVSFSFTEVADFSELGTYEITVSTNLVNDEDPANNSATITVENVLCQPVEDCSFGDGFTLFSIAEINNVSACEGYGDFTNLVANLDLGSTNSLTITTGYGDQNVKVWIDFNDDSNFTNDEVVVPNFVIAPGSGGGSYTETVDLVIPSDALIGTHRMRAKSNWQEPVPDDACEDTQYGETEDYTANIGTLGVNDNEISNSELIITSQENNNFEVTLNTNYEGKVYVAIYNMLGQQLGFKFAQNESGTYKMNLNLSSAATGVYLVRVGGQNTTTYKTGRVIVK